MLRLGVRCRSASHMRQGRSQLYFVQRHTTGVHLELYQHPDDSSPARVIDLDPVRDRTGHIWHVWVRGILPGNSTVIASKGPIDRKKAMVSPRRLLLDPYARAIAGIKD